MVDWQDWLHEKLSDVRDHAYAESYSLSEPDGRDDAMGSLLEARRLLDEAIERLRTETEHDK